jgi:hypothetical protein
MEDLAGRQHEAAREVRSARLCLLVVTLLQLAAELIFLYVLKLPNGLADAPAKYQTPALVFALAFFAVFATLWVLSKRWPKICLILALVLFWAIQLLASLEDASQLYKGILIKIIFSVLLIKGIRSASRGEALGKELGRVFE